MSPRFLLLICIVGVAGVSSGWGAEDREPRFTNVINLAVPHIATDKSVRYDYDIVYVRAARSGDKVHKRFYTDFSQPVTMEPGAVSPMAKSPKSIVESVHLSAGQNNRA